MNTAIIFIIGSLLGVSLCVFGCRQSRKFMNLMFALMVLSTFNDKLSINFVSRATYRAATRGFEIHLVDLFALILFIAILMRPKEFKIRAILPLTFPYLAFVLIALASWVTIWATEGYSLPNPTARLFPNEKMPSEFEIGLYPLFEISKLLRGFFVYWTVAHFFTNKKTIKILLICFAALLLFFTSGSIIDRYVFGTFRTAFILDTNIFNCYLGMIGAFVTPFIFQASSWLLSLGFAFLLLCSVICVIFTVSRSSLLGLLVGSAVATGFSLWRFRQRKNLIILFFISLAVLAMLVKASGTLSERFFHAETVSAGMEIREKYIIEAKEMGSNHILGVGLGNFSAFGQDEYSQLLSGDVNSSMAHNIWYLTFGESGWLGLTAFAVIWIRFFQLLFTAMRSKKLRAEPILYATLIGVLGAVIMLHVQSLFHFAFRVTPIYFLFHILAGLMTRIYLMDKKQWLIK